MCGICGIYGMNNKRLIKRMTDVIRHRGPDDSGIFSDDSVELGHRRLSIIDLSKAGAQPMSNEDGSITIVFNGEIYNFSEIRAELKNHTFRSDSDTEVLIHGYEEWGLPKLLSKLNGMFAFAIWDSSKKRIFLARDRLGIKPLYYAKVGDICLFASEIKSILEYEEVGRELNPEALDDYLSFRYVPGPKTLFKGIYCLEAGHYMVVNGKGVAINKYWDLEFPVHPSKNEDACSKRLFKLLGRSVKRRLLSDVPLGAYLSGGIDSASIVSLMSKMSDEPVKTFTVGFGADIEADEIGRARRTSELFSTDHHELIIEPNHLKQLPKIMWHLDQPIGDSIVVANYYLSQLARKKVTVVLSGEGADELFAGYLQYRNLIMGRRLRLLTPGFLRSGIMIPTIKRLPISFLDKFFDYPESLGEHGRQRIVEFLRNLGDETSSYLSNISLFNESDKKDLLQKSVIGRAREMNTVSERVREKFLASDQKDLVNKVLYRELKTWLPENILFRNDKMTMANSIEGRVPFLDHELVEFSASVPSYLKIKRMTEKFILRSAMRGKLPAYLTERKKKAFYIPVTNEFDKALFELSENILDYSKMESKNIFQRDYIRNILLNNKKSRFIFGKQLVSLMNFEMWYRIYILGENPKNIIS